MNNNKKEFLEILQKKAGNISSTCNSLNMARSTFYDWCTKDKEFNKGVEDVKESLLDLAESKLMKLINDENVTALIFFLKTQGKKRGYIERVESDVNIKSIPIINVDPLAEEDEDDSTR